ncbi:MAG TPA: ABC transporter substrate-binding protein [Gaiellaceae bacterium]|jgi:branched-chain amino acid transport system substrate-binding protein|nr:ABC transporter substrate-binding protein [Gaiellaceae bacterium]
MKVGRWKLLLPLALVGVAATVATSGALAGGSQATTVKIGIMTDCKGAFAFGYEPDIGGAQASFSQYAGAKPKNKKKPSAGMTGGTAGGASLKIVGYGCGDESPALALKETRRLMVQLGADVMIGPLSGDEAVTIANWAKQNPKKTVIIGTAGSQDPTMQIAPKNLFRYHGDGAQWNAGLGEILYKKLGWRTAALIGDDYSFPWTSAAGIIADFCGIGGKITKRVWTPPTGGDYAPYIRQLPPPDKVDGYFWLVGGANTGSSLSAYEQIYGKLDPKKISGNLFLFFLGNYATVAPKLIGTYFGGFGTGGGIKTKQALTYAKQANKWYPGVWDVNDGFFYNYWNAAWALVQGLDKSNGAVGPALQAALPKSIKPGFQVANGGVLKLDSRRQAIQDQYPLQIVKGKDGKPAAALAGYVPNVDQTFGGYFGPSKPAPSRSYPPCKKAKLPWQGKIRVIKNGVITNQTIK